MDFYPGWIGAPGLFNSLCLNVMFVSSVSTLLFNANPLMRFDGYYILADLVEIPNLRQKAATIVQRKLGRWLLGLRERPDPLLPARQRGLLAAYGMASAVYGWLVSLSIFWFLYRVLEPHGLKLLGQALGLAMIVSLIVLPVVRLLRFIGQPSAAKELRPMRAFASFSVLTILAAFVLCVPWPYYVAAVATIEPRDAISVYVEVPGELRAALVSEGDVTAGQTIAELDDIEVRLALQRLVSHRAETVARIEGIRQRAHADDSALLELSQAEEALTALDAQVARLKLEVAKLTVRAPMDGILLPPASRPDESSNDAHLTTWSGRPLELRNVGAFLPASTLLGRIAQPSKFEAILAIPQEEMDFVAVGQSVDVLLPSHPGKRLRGQVVRISSENLPTERDEDKWPSQASSRNSRGPKHSHSTVRYQASLPLDDESCSLVVGTTGTARIQAGYQPLWQRAWRTACQVFHFEM